MKIYRTHILIAEDSKSILEGASEIKKVLVNEIDKKGLQDEISVIPTGSLGFEDIGIAMAVYPEGIVYAPIKVEDIPEIVEEHLLKGRIVKRLVKRWEKKEVTVGITRPEYIKGSQYRAILRNVGMINPESIEEYIANGGYVAFEKTLSMKPEDVINQIKMSELKGRGGAGFPTGLKWEFTAKAKNPEKYIICNADEGEPGTFKDREIMEGDPHTLLEGMLIAGYAVGSGKAYIYIRGEYMLSIDRLEKAVNDAKNYGLLGKNILGTNFSFDVEIKKGAGAYICGEETALLDSIEGKRGEPRKKPPYPPTSGLWNKPTVINNVETLANIPLIIAKGVEWFKSIGVPGTYGTKLFSLMGDVNWKGVIEVPFGTPLSKIVMDIAGGVARNRKLKAVVLGGVSGSLIVPDEIDTPVDFNSLARIEAGPGSGSIVVLDDTRCIVDIAKNIAYFFKHESCGKCTTCRVGTELMYKIVDKICRGGGTEKDLDILEKLSKDMQLTSFCGLGQAAPNIIVQSIKKFRDEWLTHIREKKCPMNVCKMDWEEEQYEEIG